MTTPHRYQLQPYKTIRSRHTCPGCGHKHKFTLYIDTQTNNHLANYVGKCSRAVNCGYHYTPKQYFAANPTVDKPAYKPQNPQPLLKPDTLPMALLNQSLSHYKQNNFVHFMGQLFTQHTVANLIRLYNIGTSKHWHGATVFWQVDAKNKVRTGKIMLYDPETCKRVKEPFNHIAWAHRMVHNPKIKSQNKLGVEQPKSNFNLSQCLFGEHLLNEYPDKIIALVESEKTAIIAAGFMPEYLWLATGSLNGLNAAKCKALKGRSVMLFPDIDGFFTWQDKALSIGALMPTTQFRLSDLLHRNTIPAHRSKGMDIADLYIDDHFRAKQLEREWGLVY